MFAALAVSFFVVRDALADEMLAKALLEKEQEKTNRALADLTQKEVQLTQTLEEQQNTSYRLGITADRSMPGRITIYNKRFVT